MGRILVVWALAAVLVVGVIGWFAASGSDTSDDDSVDQDAASEDSQEADPEITGNDNDDGSASHPGSEDEPEVVAPVVTAVPLPEGVLTNIRDLGAVGDGITDDTAAIQAALDEGRRVDGELSEFVLLDTPLGLYFPPGDYLITEPLVWHGCCVTIQGAGTEETRLLVADAAPAFGDSDNPAPVLTTEDGNESFRQHVRDLTINTGSSNPAAIGLDFIANNTASVDNVHIISGDGAGLVGLDMSREWPGPLLVQDLTVDGFDVGIYTRHNEYGPTFERITLANQNQVGFLNEGNVVAIRGLNSSNSVPVLSTIGSAIIIDGELVGGDDDAAAVINEDGELYLRNVTSTGYRVTVADQGEETDGPIDEYLSGDAIDLFEEEDRPLKLAVKDTPKAIIEPTDTWARYQPEGTISAADFQAVLDSGAGTVSVDFGRYMLETPIEVTVPASVHRLVGFSAAIDAGTLRLIIEDSSDQPLVIEEFNDGVTLVHRSDRTVAFAHGRIEYESTPEAGDLFLEDVLTSGLRVSPGQFVWARQLNVEGYTEGQPRVVNDNGVLWVLGIKTERPGTVIQTVNGGQTEVLGTLIYPVDLFTEVDQGDPAFVSVDSDLSAIYTVSSYAPNTNYDAQVRDTRDGDTRELKTEDIESRHIALYVGKGRPR